MLGVKKLKKIAQILSKIYSENESKKLIPIIEEKINKYKKPNNKINNQNNKNFSHKDILLITYPDTFKSKNIKNLKILNYFLQKNCKEFSNIHILPFFPSSSDYGFSIKDYKKVDEKNGSWKDIEEISKNKNIMVDLVLNHVSKEHYWFKEFIKGNKKYKDYFIHYPNKINTSKIFRPRTNLLLTKFKTKFGKKYVLTTFSPDQIDLNYHNPKVLLEITDILLFYISKGIKLIRLDAIPYIWNTTNCSSVNLDKNHLIISFFKELINQTNPKVKLVIESNFPTEKNISYLAKNEADIIYNFSLPPLVIFSFLKENSTKLKKYFSKKINIGKNKTFINFLASHDGVGVVPLKEFVSIKEFKYFINEMKKHGGLVSNRNKNQCKLPYEININYFDAINNPNKKNNKNTQKKYYEINEIKKFIAAHAIIMFSKGLPAIYIQSLIGSRNNMNYKKDKIKRTINRQKFRINEIEEDLSSGERKTKIFEEIKKIIRIRKKYTIFSPFTKQKILKSNKELLFLERSHLKNKFLLIVNFSKKTFSCPKYKNKILINYSKKSKNIRAYETCLLKL
jgi:glucosylglycerate phosphorylase